VLSRWGTPMRVKKSGLRLAAATAVLVVAGPELSGGPACSPGGYIHLATLCSVAIGSRVRLAPSPHSRSVSRGAIGGSFRLRGRRAADGPGARDDGRARGRVADLALAHIHASALPLTSANDSNGRSLKGRVLARRRTPNEHTRPATMATGPVRACLGSESWGKPGRSSAPGYDT